jgi:hypothetical protein
MYIIAGAIVALAVAGVLAWTRFAPAQPPPPPTPLITGDVMTITAPEGVEVRSGPSMSFYATSKLRFGDKVEVVKSDKNNSGWLAIKPPPGSRSWIDAKFVKLNGRSSGIVYTDPDQPVPVKPASSLSDQEPPNVESAKAERGTHVAIVGDVKFGASSSWLPIEPVTGEVRYIPESAVARSSGVQPVSATGASGFVPPPGGDQSLLAQADAALAKARELYQKAAQSSDVSQRNQALSRLQSLDQLTGAGATGQPGYPFTTTSSGPRVQLGAATTPASTTGGSTALYQTADPANAAKWGSWGTLRRTSFQKDGQPMYRLVDDRGVPLGYAVAAPGLTLAPYVDQFVCLYGVTAYHSDDAMRGNYTIVSRLARP